MYVCLFIFLKLILSFLTSSHLKCFRFCQTLLSICTLLRDCMCVVADDLPRVLEDYLRVRCVSNVLTVVGDEARLATVRRRSSCARCLQDVQRANEQDWTDGRDRSAAVVAATRPAPAWRGAARRARLMTVPVGAAAAAASFTPRNALCSDPTMFTLRRQRRQTPQRLAGALPSETQLTCPVRPLCSLRWAEQISVQGVGGDDSGGGCSTDDFLSIS